MGVLRGNRFYTVLKLVIVSDGKMIVSKQFWSTNFLALDFVNVPDSKCFHNRKTIYC